MSYRIIISPKFEISGILWFLSGRRRRMPRLASRVTGEYRKTKMATGGHFVKI